MVHRYQGFAMIYEPLTMNFFYELLIMNHERFNSYEP